jgi:hypothetical protein
VLALRPEADRADAEQPHLGSTAAAGTVELVEFHGHDHVAVVRLDAGDEIRARLRDQVVRAAASGWSRADARPVVAHPFTAGDRRSRQDPRLTERSPRLGREVDGGSMKRWAGRPFSDTNVHTHRHVVTVDRGVVRSCGPPAGSAPGPTT